MNFIVNHKNIKWIEHRKHEEKKNQTTRKIGTIDKKDIV